MRKFKVVYDGKVIEHQYAVDSVVEVISSLIDRFGAREVLQADQNPHVSKYRQCLVATSPNDFNARDWSLYNGVYISRDLGHEGKKRYLERIGENLSALIRVEID